MIRVTDIVIQFGKNYLGCSPVLLTWTVFTQRKDKLVSVVGIRLGDSIMIIIHLTSLLYRVVGSLLLMISMIEWEVHKIALK